MKEIDRELNLFNWSELLVRLTGRAFSSELCLRQAAGDQMLNHSLLHHRDAGVALSQYFAVSLQQFSIARQVIQILKLDQRQPFEVLDFACGYGRLLRLLGSVVPSSQTWAADIQSDAVRFVAENFGVNPLISDADPEKFDPQRSFDMIWVASLFSHLPENLFHAWFRRLTSFLKPDGVLCFSVRDTELLPQGTELPASGLLYTGESENEDLPPSIYGTAYANEGFVRALVSEVLPLARCIRIPRALANEQDLYIVAPRDGLELDLLTGIRRGPWGWVDIRRLTSDYNLDLQGWAGSLDDGVVDRVEVRLDGESYLAEYGIARPDVADAFGDTRMLMSGWSLRIPVSASGQSKVLEVEAVSKRGERAVLYAGTLKME